MEERRKAPRGDLDTPARLRGDGRTAPAVVHDVCRDAAFVESDELFAEGSPIELELELPGLATPFKVAGQVIRTAPGEAKAHGMAILFCEVPPGVAARIDFFVALHDTRSPA